MQTRRTHGACQRSRVTRSPAIIAAMVVSAGATLLRYADDLLTRSAADLTRALLGVSRSDSNPAGDRDLVGVAVDVVAARTLGRVGVALLHAERDRDRRLLDVVA